MTSFRFQLLATMLACAVTIAAFAISARAQAPNERPADIVLRSIVEGILKNDLERFLEYADSALRFRFKQEILTKVHQDIGSRMRDSGYIITYFGMMQSDGLPVYFYRMQFKDGGDDAVLKLIMKKGAVSGVFLEKPAPTMILPRSQPQRN